MKWKFFYVIWTWMSYQAMLSCFNLCASCWFRVKLFDLTFMTSYCFIRRGKQKWIFFKLYNWNYLPMYCAFEWHKWIETSIDRFFCFPFYASFFYPQEAFWQQKSAYKFYLFHQQISWITSLFMSHERGFILTQKLMNFQQALPLVKFS